MDGVHRQVPMTKTAAISLVAACLAVVPTLAQDWSVATFDDDKAGLPPPGFVFTAMRQPGSGSWLIRRQGAHGHLAHDADPVAGGYALAIRTGTTPPDVVISVRMRLAGGSKTGGLVWHYLDELNYYAAILNLARGEMSLYRMAAGNRIRTEFADDLELDPDAWHTMKVEHAGTVTRVSLGGIRVFNDDDRRHEKTGSPGRVGLLAGGDAQAWFDDLRVEAPKRGR